MDIQKELKHYMNSKKGKNSMPFIIIGIVLVIVLIFVVLAVLYLPKNITPVNNSTNDTVIVEPTLKCIDGYQLKDQICVSEKQDYNCTGKLSSREGYSICGYQIQNIEFINNYKQIFESNKSLDIVAKVWNWYFYVEDTGVPTISRYNPGDPAKSIEITSYKIQETPTLTNLSKSIKLTIRAPNPQFNSGQDMKFLYTIENIDNKSITISSDVSNGVVLKNSAGKVLDFAGSGNSVKLIKESVTIEAGQKINSEFIIGGSDYDLTTLGNSGDGYYNTIIANIGDINSNKIILRILKPYTKKVN